MSIGAEAALPESRTVLLLVDVINPFEFVQAKDLAASAWKAAKAIAKLKQRLIGTGVLCIYANDNYGRWRSDFRDTLAYCMAKVGVAGQLARLLAPGEADLVMLKPRHSAFYATPLDLVLTQARARQLVIVGLAADICVQLTAMDASLRGYGIWVPGDCTAAEKPERSREALHYMKRVLKADIHRSTTARLPKAPRVP